MTNHCTHHLRSHGGNYELIKRVLAFILVLSSNPNKYSTVSLEGKEKKTWFISLPRGVDSYPWDQGGEDGDFYGRSIKSECSFHVPSSSFPSLRSFCVSSHIAPP